MSEVVCTREPEGESGVGGSKPPLTINRTQAVPDRIIVYLFVHANSAPHAHYTQMHSHVVVYLSSLAQFCTFLVNCIVYSEGLRNEGGGFSVVWSHCQSCHCRTFISKRKPKIEFNNKKKLSFVKAVSKGCCCFFKGGVGRGG